MLNVETREDRIHQSTIRFAAGCGEALIKTLPRRRRHRPRPTFLFLALGPGSVRLVSCAHRRKALGGRRFGAEEGIGVLALPEFGFVNASAKE
jgi:hypothetical protein